MADKEFGEGLLGRVMLVVKGLYGLKTSAARFQEHLADILRSLGFKPSKTDSNLWYRDNGDHYEYCACYVDDLLIWSKDPMKIVKQLETVYELKGTGSPEYFLGADIEVLDEHWQNEGVGLGISARTYIEQIVPKFEQLFNVTLRGIKTPMDKNYHPEIDASPLLGPEDASKYCSVLGALNWVVTLGRFDIQYATSAMSRFCFAPRKGHMLGAHRILHYLKAFPKGRIIVDTNYFDHSAYQPQEHES